MRIPQFWAEARTRRREDGKQVTVRRFGWSDDNQAAAQRHADERAEQAMRQILLGERLERRERKVPYGGADGMPIREEIVERAGDVIVTRNSYGARCLNTPDVLFADIDFQPEPSAPTSVLMFVVPLILGVGLAFVVQSAWVLVPAVLAALLVMNPLANAIHRRRVAAAGGYEARALAAVTAHARANPHWHMRVYRTPAGYRVLVMHSTFEPHDAVVDSFFRSIDVDPAYVRLCKAQNCFRARVSPKPWRIGINVPMRSVAGVWPVQPERMAQRSQWVEAYEKVAQDFASCCFVTVIGEGGVNEKAELVRQLHDAWCQSDSELAIA